MPYTQKFWQARLHCCICQYPQVRPSGPRRTRTIQAPLQRSDRRRLGRRRSL